MYKSRILLQIIETKHSKKVYKNIEKKYTFFTYKEFSFFFFFFLTTLMKWFAQQQVRFQILLNNKRIKSGQKLRNY